MKIVCRNCGAAVERKLGAIYCSSWCKDEAYNRAHPDRNSRIGKAWRARNPDKVRLYNKMRRKAEAHA